MRYKINFDRVINQLTPYYLGGRRLILYLQSCMSPLRKKNDEFIDWAKETRIEAAMTSQIFKLEWFLNRKFQKYFLDPEQRITIQNGMKPGVPLFYQNVTDSKDFIPTPLYRKDEGTETAVFHYNNEQTTDSSYSFMVYYPALNINPSTNLLEDGVSENEFLGMLRFYIERYRISNKTYTIICNDERI